MATTGYARTMAGAPVVQPARPDRPATGDDWEVLAIHQADPPTSQPWWLGVYCTAETDPGTTGQLRLRSAQAGSGPTLGPVQRDIYYTNFPTAGTHSVLGPEWERYNATPGNGGFGVRSDSQIEVVAEGTAVDGANVLRLTAENVGGEHYHGGVKLKIPFQYGEVEFRMRTTADASEVTSGLAILWPRSDVWPRDGEVDLVESFGNRDTRTPLEFYIHRRNPTATSYATDPGTDQFQGRNHVDPFTGDPLNGTAWHKFVFTWAPDRVAVSIDNGTERVLIDDPAWIPDWPMELTFQLDAWSNTPPATPVTMDVDYVVVRSLEVQQATGTWGVAGGRIIDRTGAEFISAGMNGGVTIDVGGAGTQSFGGPSKLSGSVAWAWDGFGGDFQVHADIWPGDANVFGSTEVFPGGHPTGYIDQYSAAASAFVRTPDRVYALTGQRSQWAIDEGIEQPSDHWHSRLYRIAAVTRPGPLTWSGATDVTADDTIPQYVARARELIDRGLVVAVQHHAHTGTDPTLPAALIADPTLPVTDSALAGSTYDNLRDTLQLLDALCAEFGPDDDLWVSLPNEAWASAVEPDYIDFVVTLVTRIREAGWNGIVTIPLAQYCGDLAGVANGDYDDVLDALIAADWAGNLVWEWHNYGKNTATNDVYTYGQCDAHLQSIRSARRFAIWMAEYGQATPIGTSVSGPDAWTREGVLIAATNTYGEALAVKHRWLCATWWALADNSFDRSYSLTYGAVNKGNEAGPDPHAFPNTGTYPWWDVTTEALADEWLTPGGRAHWDVAHLIWQDPDAVRTGVSPAVAVSGHTRNVRLGFEQIPLVPQRVFIEGRRLTGTGALRLHRTAGSLVSAPPVELRTSDVTTGGGSGGGGGGGGGTPVVPSSVRSTWQSVGQSTSHTVTPASFDPPAQAGDKIVFIAAAAGVTEVPSLTLTLPGSPLVPKTAGTGFNPQVACTVTDYNASGWTLTGSFAFRAVAICLRDTVSVAASAASEGSSPLNPASVAHGANALGLAVNVLNYTGASVLTPATTPAAHEVVLATPIDIRQIHVASVDLASAGTYDPGAATIGPGTESSVAFSLAAWPASSTTAPAAPTIPAWDGTGATTLGLTDNIASIVAAAAPGAKFQLVSGTYSSPGFDNVRPKTGQRFQGPASGTATLEGTGKTWCMRAIDATGSSDNVMITGPAGSIVVQNYGNGTARQEFGAIQAGPMDTGPGSSDYTYGVAQGWVLSGVNFIKNSAGGYRCSDYTVVSDCGFWGHTVSGLSYEMATGGRFHDCDFDANGLNPATGAFANGAGCKLTWSNATGIRNAILASGIRRAKAPLIFTDCSWSPTHAGVTGSGRIALWLDLDCQQVQIWNPTIGAHADAGIIIEGCNGVTIDGGSIDNCDGYGAANGENFIAGALTIGEAQNVVVDGLAISNSVRAIVIRQSGRADWNGPISSNVAYTTKGWLTAAQEPRPGLLDQASQWTSNITIRNHVLTNCDRVILSEGANAGGMNVVGSLPVATFVFEGGDYSGSSNLVNATSGGGFFDRSNSGVTLTAWQAKPEQRDQ